jgi:hypothetical protein
MLKRQSTSLSFTMCQTYHNDYRFLFVQQCMLCYRKDEKKIHANQKCEFVLQVLIVMANSAVFMWPRDLECCKIIFKSGQKNQT